MLIPQAGRVYRDSQGRLLTVTEVRPTDRVGRDVIGLIAYPQMEGQSITDEGWPQLKRTYSEPADYSCTASTFRAIWTEEVE